VVAPTELSDRIDTLLTGLEAELAFLPEAEAGWPTWSEAEREAFRVMWELELADRLAGLAQHQAADALTDDQRRRYRALKRQLCAAAPVFRALQITPPRLVPPA
jgi:hypothetical protein